MFSSIFLLWTLSVSPHVQLFWDVLFFAPLVLSLIWKSHCIFIFKLCAKFSLWLQESSKVVTCCPENRFCPWTEKFTINHQIIFLIWIFLTVCLYNCRWGICYEFFALSCRSIPKKFFTTYCSVFHRFRHVLPFLSFANLKLDFSLQNTFW